MGIAGSGVLALGIVMHFLVLHNRNLNNEIEIKKQNLEANH